MLVSWAFTINISILGARAGRHFIGIYSHRARVARFSFLDRYCLRSLYEHSAY